MAAIDNIFGERIFKLIRDIARDRFYRLWLRCWVRDGIPSVSLFVQPDERIPVVSNLVPEIPESVLLAQLLSEFQCESTLNPKWNVLTLLLCKNGNTSVEYGFVDFDSVNTYKLQREWTTKHLAGLELLRSHR